MTALAIDGGTPVRRDPLPYAKGVGLLGDEERAAVLDVLEGRSLFRYYGPGLRHAVDGFEQSLSTFVGASHAVALSSGTAALRAGLAALGVGCGDEVIVPAFTFIATVNAVVVAGATPVFAEIDDSMNIDPGDVAAKVTERTRAIMPVHLENVACDMDRLLEIARSRGIAVIEDACQSLGASYHGRAVGTLGDLGCYSLQLEKNITTGEGGAVVTNDEQLWLRAARYQDQGGQFVTQKGGGRGNELAEPFVGENLRMTEIAGAIAGVQLGRLPGLLAGMRGTKRRVLEALGEVDGLVRRRIPDPDGDGASSMSWFLQDGDARRFAAALRAEGLPAVQMYNGLPVYATPSILERRTASGKGCPWYCDRCPGAVYTMGMCPRTEDFASRSVTVGLGPAWSAGDCDDAVDAIAKVAAALL